MKKIFNLFNKLRLFFVDKINYLRKKGAVIGENVVLYCDLSAFGSEPYLIKIGNDVTLTNGVHLLTHDGGMRVISKKLNKKFDKFGKITIGNNVFIGINSIILPNITIGNNVVVGAGSIVTKDVIDNVVVAGVPAKIICTIDDYHSKNINNILETRGMKPDEKKEILYETFNITNNSHLT